ncbi:MAG: antirestriction protein ArdA [Ruminiclostridium sp.]|nr:antirestriction protein ArdA [Ruminiclostridium sp.]
MPEGTNTKALYTVIESSTTTYFHSYNSGGLSFPFHIYDKAQSIAEIIRNSGFQDTVWAKDVLPLMSTDNKFYPENKNEYLMTPLPVDLAREHFENFRKGLDFGYSITLDYDRKTVGIEINRNLVHTNVQDIHISVNDPKVIKLLSMDCADAADRECEFRNAFAEPPKPAKNYIMSVKLEYNGKHFISGLPMDEDGIDTAKVNLGVNDLDYCNISVDINNRYLNSIAEISEQNFTELNSIADWAESADEDELKKFAAAVQAYCPRTIYGISNIVDNLSNIELVEVYSAEEYGHEALYGYNSRSDLTDCFSETIEDYIDFDRYGRDLMDEDGAIETEYGYIYSEDGFELDETPSMQML